MDLIRIIRMDKIRNIVALLLKKNYKIDVVIYSNGGYTPSLKFDLSFRVFPHPFFYMK